MCCISKKEKSSTRNQTHLCGSDSPGAASWHRSGTSRTLISCVHFGVLEPGLGICVYRESNGFLKEVIYKGLVIWMLSLLFCSRPLYLMTVHHGTEKFLRRSFAIPTVPTGTRKEHLHLSPGGLVPLSHTGLCLAGICTNCPFPQHPPVSFLYDDFIASSLPQQSPLGSVVPAAFYS